MTVIAADQDVITLINVFTVKPENQKQLAELLSTVTDEVMRHRSGFVSANIHLSLDGTRVVNYAQWRDQKSIRDMLADPVAQQHMSATIALGTPEPRLYSVSATHEADIKPS